MASGTTAGPLATLNKASVIAGMRELLRRVETGEAGPLDYILMGEILGWWRSRQCART